MLFDAATMPLAGLAVLIPSSDELPGMVQEDADGAPGDDPYAPPATAGRGEYIKSLFSSPEQRAYNASHKTCKACRGRGYKCWRSARGVEQENVGCDVCLGTGGVPIEKA